jgi:predicted nucleotidyltransferase
MRLDEQPAAARAVGRFLDHVHGDLSSRVVRVVLYGSSVREDWRPDSDVDLLVVVDRKDLDICLRVQEPWLDALVGDGIDVSARVVPEDGLARLRREGNHFVRTVDREGVVLWTRNSEAS